MGRYTFSDPKKIGDEVIAALLIGGAIAFAYFMVKLSSMAAPSIQEQDFL